MGELHPIRNLLRLSGVLGALLLSTFVLANWSSITETTDKCEEPELLKIDSLIVAWRWEEAESLTRALLVNAEAEDGQESLAYACTAERRAIALIKLDLKNAEDAERFARHAVNTKKSLLGTLHPEVAASLRCLAVVEMASGNRAEAETSLTQAIEICEEADVHNAAELARCLGEMATLHVRNLEAERAYRLYERVLELQENTLGPDHPELAGTLLGMSRVFSYWQPSDIDSPAVLAMERCRRASRILEQAFGPDCPGLAWALAQEGHWTIVTGGTIADAWQIYERALAICEKYGEGQSQLAGPLYNNVAGFLYTQVGDVSRARPLFEKALAITERTRGQECSQYVITLTNLGDLYNRLGDPAGAKVLYKRAIEICERAGMTVPLLVSHYIYANNLVDMGDYEEALFHAERANAIAQETPGPETVFWRGGVALNLAYAYQHVGRYTEARGYYERLIPFLMKPEPGSHWLCEVLPKYAGLLATMGDFDGAWGAYEQALVYQQKLVSEDNPTVAWSLSGMAALSARKGDVERAMELHERALAIERNAYGDAHPDVATSLAALAALEVYSGNLDLARDLALEAERISREQARLAVQSLPERQALRYAETKVTGISVALSLVGAAVEPAIVAETWDAEVQSRGLVLDEMATRQRLLTASSDPEIERLAQELSEARQALANLVVRVPLHADRDAFLGVLDEARREKEQTEQALANASPEFRTEQARNGIGFADVRNALPADAALVSYVLFERLPSAPDDAATASYLAFVLAERDAEPTAIDLGRASEIDSLVAHWRAMIGSASVTAGDGGSEVPADQHGTALRARIWDPVAPYLADSRRVFLVPDGELHTVSFAALPDSRGGYLVENEPILHYLSVERDLVPDAQSSPTGLGLLALGDPAFEDDTSPSRTIEAGSREADRESDDPSTPITVSRRSSCGAFGELCFKPLPGSREEVESISALWAKSRGSPSGSVEEAAHDNSDVADGVLVATGSDATEGVFKQAAPRCQALHIATHGFFLGKECHAATSEQRGIGGVALIRTTPTEIGENPLLLSGLALASANQREEASLGEEDGILTAEEIASLDLSGVEWAVLSACNTGVGEVKAGEGVFGLRRAFQVAGARTLIMSLWSVDDEATRHWMKRLYEARLVDGLDTAESVRAASLAVLQERRAKGESTHPFYWGAFVAAGDWR